MPVDVRLRYLDGTTETHVRLNLGELASGVPQQSLQRLDQEGWWRSFRDLSTVDGEGFVIFEEDPTIPRIKNSAPRTWRAQSLTIMASLSRRVSHHYMITNRTGQSCDLIDASVVRETEEAKIVELRVRP